MCLTVDTLYRFTKQLNTVDQYYNVNFFYKYISKYKFKIWKANISMHKW